MKARRVRSHATRINTAWHDRYPMPKAPSDARRIAWHRAHQKACNCRPVPAGLRARVASLDAATLSASSRRVPAKRAPAKGGSERPLIAGLAEAVDCVSNAFFSGPSLSKGARLELARYIAERQAADGYGGSFALTRPERARGVRVFTGERMMSASARHIIGEESCRALLLLRPLPHAAQEALNRATAGLRATVLGAADRHGTPGVFCCGKCTVSLWRHLAAGGLDQTGRRLDQGLNHLAAQRDGHGGHRKFPFFYTLLALTEIESQRAIDEIAYMAPVLRRKASRRPSAGMYAVRRHELVHRALALL